METGGFAYDSEVCALPSFFFLLLVLDFVSFCWVLCCCFLFV